MATDCLPVVVILAVEVRGPHGVDGSAVDMPDFSVPVIRLRVDMEQGSGEHPYGCPTQDHQPKPRDSVTTRSHDELRLAQFPHPSN
jgi:hypothetical protein